MFLLFGIATVLGFAGESLVEMQGNVCSHFHSQGERPLVTFTPFSTKFHADTAVASVISKYSVPEEHFSNVTNAGFAVYLDNQLMFLRFHDAERRSDIISLIDDEMDLRELRSFCFLVFDRDHLTPVSRFTLQMTEFRGADPTLDSHQYHPLEEDAGILSIGNRGGRNERGPTFVALATVTAISFLLERGWTGYLFTFEMGAMSVDGLEIFVIDEKYDHGEEAVAMLVSETLASLARPNEIDLVFVDTGSCMPNVLRTFTTHVPQAEMYIVFPGGIPVGIFFSVTYSRALEPRSKVNRESLFHGCSLSELVWVMGEGGYFIDTCNRQIRSVDALRRFKETHEHITSTFPARVAVFRRQGPGDETISSRGEISCLENPNFDRDCDGSGRTLLPPHLQCRYARKSFANNPGETLAKFREHFETIAFLLLMKEPRNSFRLELAPTGTRPPSPSPVEDFFSESVAFAAAFGIGPLGVHFVTAGDPEWDARGDLARGTPLHSLLSRIRHSAQTFRPSSFAVYLPSRAGRHSVEVVDGGDYFSATIKFKLKCEERSNVCLSGRFDVMTLQLSGWDSVQSGLVIPESSPDGLIALTATLPRSATGGLYLIEVVYWLANASLPLDVSKQGQWRLPFSGDPPVEIIGALSLPARPTPPSSKNTSTCAWTEGGEERCRGDGECKEVGMCEGSSHLHDSCAFGINREGAWVRVSAASPPPIRCQISISSGLPTALVSSPWVWQPSPTCTIPIYCGADAATCVGKLDSVYVLGRSHSRDLYFEMSHVSSPFRSHLEKNNLEKRSAVATYFFEKGKQFKERYHAMTRVGPEGSIHPWAWRAATTPEDAAKFIDEILSVGVDHRNIETETHEGTFHPDSPDRWFLSDKSLLILGFGDHLVETMNVEPASIGPNMTVLSASLATLHASLPALHIVFITTPALGWRNVHLKRAMNNAIVSYLARSSPFVKILDTLPLALADPFLHWSDGGHAGCCCFDCDKSGRPITRNLVNMLAASLCG